MDYDNSHGAKRKTASPLVHQGLMDILMKLAPSLPKADDLIEGTVFGAERSRSFRGHLAYRHGHHLRPRIQSRQRHSQSFGSGDKITVKITELENERGYFSLSLKKKPSKKWFGRKRKICRNQDSFDLIRPRRQ